MIIEPSLLIFCAQKTGEIATDYDKYCILPSEKDGFPRSTSDLYWLVAGLYKKPIYNRVLNIAQTDAKYRSLMIESVDKCEIYYASTNSILPTMTARCTITHGGRFLL